MAEKRRTVFKDVRGNSEVDPLEVAEDYLKNLRPYSTFLRESTRLIQLMKEFKLLTSWFTTVDLGSSFCCKAVTTFFYAGLNTAFHPIAADR